MKNIDELPVYSNNLELLKSYQNGNTSLKNVIIANNMAMIYKIAHQLEGSLTLFTFDDLVSEGVLGLSHAIDHYSFDFKNNFSTYASSCIWGFMKKFIQKNAISFKLYPSYQRDLKRYQELVQSYQFCKEKLTLEMICKTLDFTLQYCQEIIRLSSTQVLSFQQPIFSDTDHSLSLEESLASDFSFEETFFEEHDNAIFLLALKEYFSPLQYYIIFKRMICQPVKTLEEIGAEFHVTREATRLWEKTLKEDLKEYLEKYRSSYELKAKEKYGKCLSFVSYSPASLKDSRNYFFIKPYLSFLEEELYKIKFLYRYPFSIQEYSKCLQVSKEEVRSTYLSLKNKIESYFKSSLYSNFIKAFSLREIYSFTHAYNDETERNTIMRFASLNYDDFLSYFQDLNLKDSDKDLFQNYFSHRDTIGDGAFSKNRQIYRTFIKLQEKKEKKLSLVLSKP